MNGVSTPQWTTQAAQRCSGYHTQNKTNHHGGCRKPRNITADTRQNTRTMVLDRTGHTVPLPVLHSVWFRHLLVAPAVQMLQIATCSSPVSGFATLFQQHLHVSSCCISIKPSFFKRHGDYASLLGYFGDVAVRWRIIT